MLKDHKVETKESNYLSSLKTLFIPLDLFYAVNFRVTNFFLSWCRSNSCGVAIGYFDSKPFILINQMTDQNGDILVIAQIMVFILANSLHAESD